MTNLKPWYLSRTIWASIVTTLIGLGGLSGMPVNGIDSAAVTETVIQAITALSGLAALFGRLSARERIGSN